MLTGLHRKGVTIGPGVDESSADLLVRTLLTSPAGSVFALPTGLVTTYEIRWMPMKKDEKMRTGIREKFMFVQRTTSNSYCFVLEKK